MQRFPYSHSQIEKMDFCPRAFRYSYESDVKTKLDPVFFAAGSATEAGIEACARAALGENPLPLNKIKQAGHRAFWGSWNDRAMKLVAKEVTDGKESETRIPRDDIDWGGKTPEDITGPLENLVHQFASIGAGAGGYIAEVLGSQLRLKAKIPGTPGLRIIIDVIARVRPAMPCLECAEERAEQVRRYEAKEKNPKTGKKWGKPKGVPACPGCWGTLERPDLEADTVVAIIDYKTAASQWGSLEGKAATQSKRYAWGLPKTEKPELATGITHSGYLVGAKTGAGGWKLHLHRLTSFDLDEAEDSYNAHHANVEGGHRPMRPGYGARNCGWCDYRFACHDPANAWRTLEGPGIRQPAKLPTPGGS